MWLGKHWATFRYRTARGYNDVAMDSSMLTIIRKRINLSIRARSRWTPQSTTGATGGPYTANYLPYYKVTVVNNGCTSVNVTRDSTHPVRPRTSWSSLSPRSSASSSPPRRHLRLRCLCRPTGFLPPVTSDGYTITATCGQPITITAAPTGQGLKVAADGGTLAPSTASWPASSTGHLVNTQYQQANAAGDTVYQFTSP